MTLQEIVNEIDKTDAVISLDAAIEGIRAYPGGGPKMWKVLQALVGLDEYLEVGRYQVNKCTNQLLHILADQYGEKISAVLDELLAEETFNDKEMEFIYHNVDLLLRECNRIAWMAQNADDRAMKLLACSKRNTDAGNHRKRRELS